MNIEIIGKNIRITEAMNNMFKIKLENKISKFNVNNAIRNIKITIEKNNTDFLTCAVINYLGKYLRVEEKSESVYHSISPLRDKIENILIKERKRAYGKKNNNNLKEDKKEVRDEIIIVNKILDLKPMNTSDVKTNMNLLRKNFYLFSDINNGKTNILYKNNENNYKLFSNSINIPKYTIDEIKENIKNIKETFLVFENKDTKDLSVLYKNKENKYTIFQGNII